MNAEILKLIRGKVANKTITTVGGAIRCPYKHQKDETIGSIRIGFSDGSSLVIATEITFHGNEEHGAESALTLEFEGT